MWGLRIVGCVVKEGEGGNVTTYREGFSKKSEGLMRPRRRKTRRRNCWLTLSFNQSRRMSMDLDFFGRTEEVTRPIAHSLSTKK